METYAIILILFSIIVIFVYMKKGRSKENYDAIPDDVGNAVPQEPGVEFQFGAARPPKEWISDTDRAQQDISAKITNELTAVTNEQVAESNATANTHVIQKQNRMISEARNKSIDLQGLAKPGGLSELESNQIAMAKNYHFKGEFPAWYENLYSRQYNSKSSFINTTAMINIGPDDDYYMPNQRFKSSAVLDDTYLGDKGPQYNPKSLGKELYRRFSK